MLNEPLCGCCGKKLSAYDCRASKSSTLRHWDIILQIPEVVQTRNLQNPLLCQSPCLRTINFFRKTGVLKFATLKTPKKSETPNPPQDVDSKRKTKNEEIPMKKMKVDQKVDNGISDDSISVPVTDILRHQEYEGLARFDHR